jgi:hypothetical protein
MALLTNNYSDTPDAGVPGAKYAIGFDRVETGIAQAAINFGDALIIGTAAGTVIPANSASGKFAGIALKEQTLVTGAGYVTGDVVSVQRSGSVFVTVTEAVAAGDAAYCVVATPGKFCKTATDNLATGGVFKKAAGINGVSILEINLP